VGVVEVKGEARDVIPFHGWRFDNSLVSANRLLDIANHEHRNIHSAKRRVS
jgi:hypothetical protein